MDQQLPLALERVERRQDRALEDGLILSWTNCGSISCRSPGGSQSAIHPLFFPFLAQVVRMKSVPHSPQYKRSDRAYLLVKQDCPVGAFGSLETKNHQLGWWDKKLIAIKGPPMIR